MGVLAEDKSSDVRLVGGASRCAGTLEVRLKGRWRRVYESYGPWDQEHTAAVCRDLDCGSVLYGGYRADFPHSPMWVVSPDCLKKSSVRECVSGSEPSSWGLEVVCSDSVRLVSGSGLCSGSVQFWDQSWAGVCEEDLDQQGAEVLCGQIGCGGPSLLQAALSPLGHTFHCDGHESTLMDCPRTGSRTCSSGAALNLTCSEPIRLMGGASRCAGSVEVRLGGEWRRVAVFFGIWTQEATAAVCRDLDCGSAVYGKHRDDYPPTPVWRVLSGCVKTSVRGCLYGSKSVLFLSSDGLEVVCSDSLNRPIISLSVSDGASEAQPQGVRVQLGSKFWVKCFVEPQYPGGSFHLLSPTAPLTQNNTLPAVNHSAHFLFSDTGPAHKGNYTCVYHLQMFNHNFSSQSSSLQLSLGKSDSDLIIRVLLIVLLTLLFIPVSYYYYKVRSRRGTRQRTSEGLELDQFRSP